MLHSRSENSSSQPILRNEARWVGWRPSLGCVTFLSADLVPSGALEAHSTDQVDGIPAEERSASMTAATHEVTLLTRAGCASCVGAAEVLRRVCSEFELELTCIDVDEAAATDPELRAEYGDRLPVILLDGREHGYWEVDEERLRDDLRK